MGWWPVVGVALGVGAFVLMPAGAAGAPATAAHVARTVVVPTVLAVLTMAGFVGLGALVLERAFPGLATRQNASARWVSSYITGLAMVSSAVVVTAALGWLDLLSFALARVLLVGTGVWFAVRQMRRTPRAPWRRDPIVEALLCLLVAVGMLLLCGLLTVTSIHPDALQYHAAIPRSFRLAGGLVTNDTLLSDGLYLGFDLLYLVSADLARLTDEPLEVLRQLAVFSFLAEALLLVGAYCLSRSIGASRRWAVVAAAAMLTVSSIGRWGAVKNDLVVAGAAAVALALIVDALNDVRADRLAVAGIAVGFALSVKVNTGAALALPVVALGVRVARTPGLRLRTRLLPALLATAIVGPWMIRSAVLRGTPFYPVGMRWPERIAEGRAARNASGLELTASSLVRHWPDLMLDRYVVSGNESMGLLFLVGLTAGLGLVAWRSLRRRVTSADLVFVSGALYLAVFTVETFEARFLTRYVLFTAATTFAYLAAATSNWVMRSARGVETVVVLLTVGCIAALSWNAGLARSIRVRAHDPALGALASGTISRAELDDRMEAVVYVPLNQTVNARVGTGSVLVNDHFFLFLNAKPVNVHPVHSTVFDGMDFPAFAREMRSRDVTAAVIRGDMSAAESVLGEYIRRCGESIGTSGPLTAYVIRQECRGLPVPPGGGEPD